jgi:hypothetical protein
MTQDTIDPVCVIEYCASGAPIAHVDDEVLTVTLSMT